MYRKQSSVWSFTSKIPFGKKVYGTWNIHSERLFFFPSSLRVNLECESFIVRYYYIVPSTNYTLEYLG